MIANVFESSVFEMMSLTGAINKVPFLPGRIGRLKLFEEIPVATTEVMIEEKDGVLYLVENRPRGAAAQQNYDTKRKARDFKLAHLPVGDMVLADEIQNVRAFGSSNALESVEGVVNRRLTTMSRSLDATLEHLRMGAIKGQILDADGQTVIYDLFTEFGVSQEAEIDFDLDNANPASGVVRRKCSEVIRKIYNELGSALATDIHCFCGDAFWDDLIAHSEVRATYLAQQEAAQLREGAVYDFLRYGGITFENYRGKVGAIDFIHTDKAHFFPVGVPGLFVNYFGPADYVETVNTLGLPKYVKSSVDPKFQKFVNMEAQSNPLPLCTRPKTLILAKRT